VSGHGRRRLLDAARRLFDEQGVHGVSARAVAQAAGHRNVAAVNYHFGDLHGLLLAVVREHAEGVDATRNALLDELEERGPLTPHDAIGAAVRPLVDLLDDPDGRRYLRLINQLANHPEFRDEVNVQFAGSLQRAAAYVAPLLESLPENRRAHRIQSITGFLLYSLASQARLRDITGGDQAPAMPPLPADEVTEELVTLVEAQLRA
jgi:AcrR family transcriptional regulator